MNAKVLDDGVSINSNKALPRCPLPLFLLTPPSPPHGEDDSSSQLELSAVKPNPLVLPNLPNAASVPKQSPPSLALPLGSPSVPSPPSSPIGLTLPLFSCYEGSSVFVPSGRKRTFNVKDLQTPFSASSSLVQSVDGSENDNEELRSYGKRPCIGKIPPPYYGFCSSTSSQARTLCNVDSADGGCGSSHHLVVENPQVYRRTLSAPDNAFQGPESGSNNTSGGSLCWNSASLKGEYKMDVIDHLVKLQERVNKTNSTSKQFDVCNNGKQTCNGVGKIIPKNGNHQNLEDGSTIFDSVNNFNGGKSEIIQSEICRYESSTLHRNDQTPGKLILELSTEGSCALSKQTAASELPMSPLAGINGPRESSNYQSSESLVLGEVELNSGGVCREVSEEVTSKLLKRPFVSNWDDGEVIKRPRLARM